MLKYVFVLLLLLVSMCEAMAQDTKRNKGVFIELGGSGGFGSINYEQEFLQRDMLSLAWRVGFSLAPIDKLNGTGIVLPIMVSGVLGKSAHKMEIGLGQGLTITTKGRFFALTTAALGYRYQPYYSPWFFRATYTPLISYITDFQVQQWGGLSIGYRLKAKKL